jgi:5-methylcytosine-specific restriction endonuclease McrA
MDRTSDMHKKHRERCAQRNTKAGRLLRPAIPILYTLQDLRDLVLEALGGSEHGTGHCCYCNRLISIEDISLDHINPLNRGGLGTVQNLAPCCQTCNREKGELTADEFRLWLTFKEKYLPAVARADMEKRLRTGAGFVRVRYIKERPNGGQKNGSIFPQRTADADPQGV